MTCVALVVMQRIILLLKQNKAEVVSTFKAGKSESSQVREECAM